MSERGAENQQRKRAHTLAPGAQVGASGEPAARAVAGMRGGLGRILLTAFMLLAIVPLSIVSYLAVKRVQRDMRQSEVDNLMRIAASTAAQLQSWLDVRQYGLVLLTNDAELEQAIHSSDWMRVCELLQNRSLENVELALSIGDPYTLGGTSARACAPAEVMASQVLSLTVPVMDERGRLVATLVGYPHIQAIGQGIYVAEAHESVSAFLIDTGGRRWPLSVAGALTPNAPLRAEAASHPWSVDLPGVPERSTGGGFYGQGDDAIIGAYQWLPERQAALWVEKPQADALAQEDDLAAMLIGSTLAVALLTAVLAAVITRQLTRPIVRLTMSAVKIAGGDLDHEDRVDLERRDEIGILARAFNIMTAELRSLYTGLEHKVAERTQQVQTHVHLLEEANRELRYKAMQLRLSAEVGRVATSILDPDLLLRRVTDLVLETYAHVYDVYYVAILLQDEFGERLERLASSGRIMQADGIESQVACDERRRIEIGDESLVGQTAADGVLRSQRFDSESVQVVIPLRIGPRIIGSLDLYCSNQDALRAGTDEVEVLQSLGDQISVAIENARLYAIEREAVQRLSRLDDLRIASLGVGSRELATELNTIIGFSRLILKEADGPLTDLQRADLVAVYKSGYKLLGLVDNVITLSELESDAVEIAQQPVDLMALLQEVWATVEQRLMNVAVVWQGEQVLPEIQGDEALLRQAFLALMVAAAEQVPQERIAVHTSVPVESRDDVRVVVHIGSTGFAERCPDRTSGRCGDAGVTNGCATELGIEEMGVGLALAREIIDLHSGKVLFQLDLETGLNIVSMLPLSSN